MVPRFEPSNELWNPLFTQTAYAYARSDLRNGSKTPLTVTAYSAIDANSSNITATGGSVYKVGSYLYLGGTWGTLSPGMTGRAVYVTAINVGGDPNKFTINRGTTSGTWAAGGTTQGQAGDANNWYGLALSELGQAIAGVYGVAKADVKTQPYYEVIGCVQTEAGTSAAGDRLDSTQYVLLGGDPAKEWTTPSITAPLSELGPKSLEWPGNTA